ncbi:MAG TPA: glycosyltransferase family 1 protein [Candidatus Saccharimonadales bacterium]|nr:glycosyltransferase family 1 protein [Candidatus Saccharimonadales bacterium]
MAEAKGTLWVDVTMLVNWSGYLTGIQRVEYNLAKRYAEQPNVKFCVFHKDQRKLTEFDFKHITYKIEQLQHQKTAPAAATAVSQPTIVHRAIGKAKRTVGPLLSSRSKVFIKAQVHKLRQAGKPANEDAPIIFGKHDTFLILSGDWSDETFATMVAGMRAQTPFKVIQIVYDMLPAFFPSYFVPGMSDQFATYMKHMFAVSDGILAISESTKRDVQKFMKLHKQKEVPVQVFRLGDDFVKQEPVKPDLPVKSGDFVLCVCTVEARKNHMELYYAAREAMLRNQDFPTLVIVGKRGWLANDFLYLVENDPVLARKFLFINCTDQELAWLYKNCAFTVFPSFYEGWGLPVAESLFYGKFCLSSDTSSMPEIAGDLLEYFSPNDPMALLQKVQYYIADSAALAAREKAIAKSYKPASWDDAFTQTREFVDSFRKI